MSWASDSRFAANLRRVFAESGVISCTCSPRKSNAGIPETPVATTDDLAALLAGCAGTENQYQHPFGQLRYTDGIQAMAQAVGAYWLIDLMASHAPTIRRRAPDAWSFGIVRLAVNEIGGRRSARFDWREDTNTAPVVHQDIEYTDFPVGTFECYVVDGVALLKSEY